MVSKKNIVKTVATLGTVALGVTAATTVANADATYTVKSGDTLSSISQKFANDNSLINTIAQDNHISDINKIFVGQQLVIKGAQNQNNTQSNATANQSQATATNTNATAASNTSYSSSVSGNDAAAKAWIAARESGGSYTAANGQYIGKYQLSASYLNGDYSAANQERVADQYVASRYGSWSNAQQFWMANGWY
ncbi:LysM peptidoglycan-binding domain-containing protein [Limosilactobacillus sp.]|uniref:aggregation-promoting factor n=1 Tax=Limosilactobacillus sp. TaxID=2773925 RepID=UPI003EFBDEA2